MGNYQIFISYRRDGGEFFGKILSDKLIARGYTVFFDVESMKAGPFNNQIYEVIDQCEDFILILSPSALDRCFNSGDWVYNEISYAIRKNKNIVPIVMRDFKWPEKLPGGIEKLPLYENEELARTSSHDHIDASVNRICNLLLKSVPKGIYKYCLADKEYYKIKTPWLSPIKRSPTMSKGYLSVASHIAFVNRREQGEIHWNPDEPFKSFKEIFEKTKVSMKWYNENIDRLNSIINKVIALKDYRSGDGDDLYFYISAVIYARGLVDTLPADLVKNYVLQVIATFCYCIDWPRNRFQELDKVLIKDVCTEFYRLLPLPFDVWPDMRYISNSEHKKNFDQYAILLFDYMLECALLANDTARRSDGATFVRIQILSYYKWLRKNKIYLPKEIQDIIYRYL